jgi:hypothetical protein
MGSCERISSNEAPQTNAHIFLLKHSPQMNKIFLCAFSLTPLQGWPVRFAEK